MDLRPSTRALQRAYQLGTRMAKRDRRIIPALSGAHQYPTYILFLTVHRHRLEQLAAFEPWDAALHNISEEEGERLELRPEDPRQWDPFVNQVVVPIRCAFWYGWESVYDLRKLYDQQVHSARHETDPPNVLRVFNPQVSPLISSSPLPDHLYEEQEWDQIAKEMAQEEQERRHVTDPTANPDRPKL